MSNRLFQTVIHQTKDVVGRTVGVIDENGIIEKAFSNVKPDTNADEIYAYLTENR